MATIKIHHHKFSVTDMDRSIHFYCNLMGLELSYDVERSNLPSYDAIMGYEDVRLRIAMLRDKEGAEIALIEYRNPPCLKREQDNYYQGASQLCLQVDDIDADYKRLTDVGVPARSGPIDIVREGKLVARALYIHDPDGIAVELYEVPV